VEFPLSSDRQNILSTCLLWRWNCKIFTPSRKAVKNERDPEIQRSKVPSRQSDNATRTVVWNDFIVYLGHALTLGRFCRATIGYYEEVVITNVASSSSDNFSSLDNLPVQSNLLLSSASRWDLDDGEDTRSKINDKMTTSLVIWSASNINVRGAQASPVVLPVVWSVIQSVILFSSFCRQLLKSNNVYSSNVEEDSRWFNR